MNSLKLGVKEVMFEHDLVQVCPQDKLSFSGFWLHATKNNGRDFTIHRVLNMTFHGGSSFNAFEMIKHNPSIF